jgi:hypothetical protein
MKSFNLVETFVKTAKISLSDSPDSPCVEVTINFTLDDSLTAESVLAKMSRPEVIKIQNKLRKDWQTNGVKPPTTYNCTIDNDERNTDPLQAFRALIAKKRGCKVSEVSDADALRAKALLEELI